MDSNMDKMFAELRDAMLASPNKEMQEYGKRLALIMNGGKPLRTVDVAVDCTTTSESNI